MWLGLEPITHTLLIQNMAGDKCTQEAKPGLDGTGRHWTGPGATGQGSVVGGRKPETVCMLHPIVNTLPIS